MAVVQRVQRCEQVNVFFGSLTESYVESKFLSHYFVGCVSSALNKITIYYLDRVGSAV